MATVRELTAAYENFMLAPRRGPAVCRVCFNFTAGFEECLACSRCENAIDAMVPISYSVAGEQLHHALAHYKRCVDRPAHRLRTELAAVLWRFLARHERCAARAAGAERFSVVTTVPSTDPARDRAHPLRSIVGELAEPTRRRYERVLVRSRKTVERRKCDVRKYLALRRLDQQDVLLIDDTWTTGSSAQSAAHALKAAGATRVAVVVIGRHLNRGWHQNDRRLRGIRRPFDWRLCAWCADPAQMPEG